MILQGTLKRFADEILESDYFVGGAQLFLNRPSFLAFGQDIFESLLSLQKIFEEIGVDDEKL